MKSNKAIAITLAAVMSISVPLQITTAEAASKNTSKLRVTKNNLTLTVGKSKTVAANETVTWKSSNQKIAKVTKITKKKAKITAKAKGTCIITVKSGKKQAKIKVTVKAKKTNQPTIKPDNSQTPNPTATPFTVPSTEPTTLPSATPSVVTTAAVVSRVTNDKIYIDDNKCFIQWKDEAKITRIVNGVEQNITIQEVTAGDKIEILYSGVRTKIAAQNEYLDCLVGCEKVTILEKGDSTAYHSVYLTINNVVETSTLTIHNETDKEVSTGKPFVLEKLEDGVWKKVPFKQDIAFTMEICSIAPGKSFVQTITLDSYFDNLTQGLYRISKTIYSDTTYEVSVEFMRFPAIGATQTAATMPSTVPEVTATPTVTFLGK